MGQVQIEVPRDRVSKFCKRNHIRKLSLFGSVLRGDFRENSDVDVLIEFESGHGTGFFGLARMERELSSILGRKVDLRTPQELSKYFRDEVLSQAEIQYAEG
jgi:predicted nucleotidyltransferase